MDRFACTLCDMEVWLPRTRARRGSQQAVHGGGESPPSTETHAGWRTAHEEVAKAVADEKGLLAGSLDAERAEVTRIGAAAEEQAAALFDATALLQPALIRNRLKVGEGTK